MQIVFKTNYDFIINCGKKQSQVYTGGRVLMLFARSSSVGM